MASDHPQPEESQAPEVQRAPDPPNPAGPPGPVALTAPNIPGGYEPPSVRQAREQRSRSVLLLIVRLMFMVLLVVVTMLTVASEEQRPQDFDIATFIGLLIAATAVGIIVLVVDAMLPNKRLTSVVGVYLGIGAGLLVALALGFLIDVVAEAWGLSGGRMDTYRGLVKVVIAIVLCYLSVSVVLTTKDDFRLVIPYVEFAKQVRGIRPLVLDTSVLVDGRIESIGLTGFLDAPIIVPHFVIDELQQLADSGDKMKRARGRRGLTVVGKLQENPYLDVSIDDFDVAGRGVDHMLLEMAKQQNLRILTTDYNLNKVAQIQGVTVLNINDLANSLKSQAIPGETLRVEIVKPGEGPTQGVGYMPDGTMVVVEQAADRIGETVQLTVTNSLQTSAGRMIFGKAVEDHDGSADGEMSPIAHAATHQPRATERPNRVEGTPRRNPRRG